MEATREIIDAGNLLSVAGFLYFLELTAYTASVLLNGVSYTNTWLVQHPWSIPLMLFFPLAFMPLGKLLLMFDIVREERDALTSQLGYTGMWIMLVSAPLWLYFEFNPPTSTIAGIVKDMIGLFFWIGVFKGVVASTLYATD